jgi:hypothetical protein
MQDLTWQVVKVKITLINTFTIYIQGPFIRAHASLLSSTFYFYELLVWVMTSTVLKLVPPVAARNLYVSQQQFRLFCQCSDSHKRCAHLPLANIEMDMSYARMVRTASLTSYSVRCKILHQRTHSLKWRHAAAGMRAHNVLCNSYYITVITE